jgi:hypothetical protein
MKQLPKLLHLLLNGGTVRQLLRVVILSGICLLCASLLRQAFGLLRRSSILSSRSIRTLTLRSSLGWLFRRVSVPVVAAAMILVCSEVEKRGDVGVTRWRRPPWPCS